MWENIREAFDGIRSHMLRSMLTMLGIIIGIASIIAISSTIMGTNERIKENLIGAGSNTVVVQLYQGDYPYETAYNPVPQGLKAAGADTLSAIRSLEEVEDAAYYVSRDAYSTIFHGSKVLSQGAIYGVDDRFTSVYGYVVRAGRGFVAKDFTELRKVALIDHTVSISLFEGMDPVGQTIEISSEPYTIIGEFAPSSQTELKITSLQDYFTYANEASGGKVLIPMETWPVVFQYDTPRCVAIRAHSTDTMTTAGKKASDLMNKLVPEGADIKYKSQDLLEQAKKLQDLSGATNRQLILVASISLLVGGIGVMNIMLVSVTERTGEIGLKKALGARKRTISGQFLIEAGVLTCLGGILGVLVGIALAYIISRVSGVPIFISWYIIAGTVLFSFLIGVSFGAFPAVKAAGLNPIEALRHE